MNVQQLVDDAIKNSKCKKPGKYEFKDFLTSGQFPANTPKSTQSNAETQFYAEVIKGSVENVVAKDTESKTIAHYEKIQPQ